MGTLSNHSIILNFFRNKPVFGHGWRVRRRCGASPLRAGVGSAGPASPFCALAGQSIAVRGIRMAPVLAGIALGVVVWTSLAGSAVGEEPRLVRAPLPRQAWVHHAVIPWERLAHVAERYGVTEGEIRQWNQLSDVKQPLRSNMTLRILARRFPPPRSQLTHIVLEGQSWRTIARRFGHGVEKLKRWNPRHARRGLVPGDQLVLWMDSSLPGIGTGVRGRRGELVPVPSGGISVGRPSKGKLKNGIRLPESESYTIRIPHQAYGTTLAVRTIQEAIADFRYQSAFTGQIVIGAMSRPRGRSLPPHSSHQSGRDVDIWLPAMPHCRPGFKPKVDEVDWHASWLLIKAFVDTDRVHRIYLDRKVFRRLRRASKEFGVSWETFSSIVSGGGIVWHQPGHDRHIHVRFKCSPEARRCRPRVLYPAAPQAQP